MKKKVESEKREATKEWISEAAGKVYLERTSR